ncbi:MAG: DUF5317 family protein [Coriobacteriia bacterium]
MILLEVVILALGASLLTGGSLRGLEHEHLRGEWLFLLLLPIQIAWPRLAGIAGVGCTVSLWVWLTMMVSLSLVLALNVPRRWVLAVAALGIALNALVIALNGAMPVSMRSVSEIGASRADALTKMQADCLHEPLDGETRLAVLADLIPIPGPQWQRGVVSMGDLLLAMGLGGWVFVATRGRTQ